jgi:hypothetical protein
MEQSGRNQWQPVADGMTSKAAQTHENRCRGLPPVALTPAIANVSSSQRDVAARLGATRRSSTPEAGEDRCSRGGSDCELRF